MPNFYHRDQMGAPAYTLSATASSAAHFNALKLILKACLVEGYGSHPPAGWELIDEGTQFIALRTGTQSGYVILVRPTTSSEVVQVWLGDVYSGMSGLVPQGVVKTGVAAANTVPQTWTTHQLAHSSAGWYVVADDTTFILSYGGSGSFNDTSGYRGTLYVGEDTAGNFVSLGGARNASGGSSEAFDGGAGFTALRSPATGLLVDSGSISIITPGLTQPASSTYTSLFETDEVTFSRVYWVGDGVKAGRLKGIAISPDFSARWPGATARALGAPEVTHRQLYMPLPLDDGSLWLLCPHSNSSATNLVTDAAEYWS